MFKKLIVFTGLTLSITAQSAIIDLGNVTRDTDTQLDWLDLTETREMSYNEVSAELAEGGSLYGWRYARVRDFDQLVTNFGYTAVDQSCSRPRVGFCDDGITGDSAIIELMIRTLGDTWDAYLDSINFPTNNDHTDYAAGFVEGIFGENIIDSDNNLRSVARITDLEARKRSDLSEILSDQDDSVLSHYGLITVDASLRDVGSFLIRDVEVSEVPVPAAAWLFGSALISLAGLKRKK